MSEKFTEDEIYNIEHLVLDRVIELGRIARENRNTDIDNWANAELLKLGDIWKKIKKEVQEK